MRLNYYFAFNYGGKREVIKEFGEIFPNVRISVFSAAFIIKAINLSDLTTLVVASENGDSVSVSDFECDEQSDAFHTMIASIDVVSHK